jgi:hypothetical protein
LSASVNRPVDSITRSTSTDSHGIAAGSRSAKTLTALPLTEMPSSVALISAS